MISIAVPSEVFDTVRLVTDIPRVVTLVSIDERMAFAAMEKYYDQFDHTERQPRQVARDYLSKVFQASVRLPPMEKEIIRSFVRNTLFDPSEEHNNTGVAVLSGDHVHARSQTLSSMVEVSQNGTESVRGNQPGASAHTEGGAIPEVQVDASAAATEAFLLPAEVDLFEELAQTYRFGNPRLLWRLHLAWRLFKSLLFGSNFYTEKEIDGPLRILFWRERWLQNGGDSTEGDPDESDDFDIKNLKTNRKTWDKFVGLADTVLLPASASIGTK